MYLWNGPETIGRDPVGSGKGDGGWGVFTDGTNHGGLRKS